MQRVSAPAKLTRSLRVVGRRDDGYHLLDAEMVSLDLADLLEFGPGRGVEVVDEVVGGLGLRGLRGGPANLVERALAAVGRQAAVRVVKRIPVGAGLGGGSADAAAVLRWAGRVEPALAAGLGADVPFCVVGGRARVGGIGEDVRPLPFEPRRFLLLLPPLGVDTAAVYRAFDEGHRPPRRAGDDERANDLEPAAVAVEPRLARWRDALADAWGRPPGLAGSGSTWFVELRDGDEARARALGPRLTLHGEAAPLVLVDALAAPGPDAPLPPRGAGVSDDDR